MSTPDPKDPGTVTPLTVPAAPGEAGARPVTEPSGQVHADPFSGQVAPAYDSAKVVTVLYTNHRGETRPRTIVPARIWFGYTEWHRTEQWLMDAIDVDRSLDEGRTVTRTFAMRDMSDWTPQL